MSEFPVLCSCPVLWTDLGLSEDVGPQLFPLLQNGARLLRGDADLEGGGHGGVDEAADDGADLVLDGSFLAVRVAQVLKTADR